MKNFKDKRRYYEFNNKYMNYDDAVYFLETVSGENISAHFDRYMEFHFKKTDTFDFQYPLPSEILNAMYIESKGNISYMNKFYVDSIYALLIAMDNENFRFIFDALEDLPLNDKYKSVFFNEEIEEKSKIYKLIFSEVLGNGNLQDKLHRSGMERYEINKFLYGNKNNSNHVFNEVNKAKKRL